MLLINPDLDRHNRLGRFAHYTPRTLPFSIGALAGYLIERGRSIRILDEQLLDTDAVPIVEEYLKGLSRPFLFGISCVTSNIARGYELARSLKFRFPDAKIIFGGIHPTVLPEEALGTGYVDIVVRGEGEMTLDLLYEALKSSTPYYHLKGISFRDGLGNIIHNPSADSIPDINELPPFPYRIFERHIKRYRFGFLSTSRGCPYNCIFCSQRSISGRQYRALNLEKVMDQLDLLINKYRQRYIGFLDDNFIVDKERTKMLCDLIQLYGFNKKAAFDVFVRGDSIDRDILSNLKRAGFQSLNFGIETASERLMRYLKKGETVKQNIEAVKLAKCFGFRCAATFILGLPTETQRERRETYLLANRLKLDCVRFNVATPYPGTKLYDITAKENRLIIYKYWQNFNVCGVLVEGLKIRTPLAYVPLGTDELKLRKEILRANLFSILRPMRMFYLLKGSSPLGWFNLPSRWYLYPKEWQCLILFAVENLGAFLKLAFLR